ncbi:hypothetical protein RMSM_07576 [Rhodopirellula maiorica SM1]|uniref:Uncharacterized protein n=1 Tax=Rhodopirellula maiorica SM1 TaxID=1265738 RepID=M5RJE6_9BACT|nr:hypothetical protein [Rhodopirellula maiorica]EMI15502.1 hypothetical protein RMSM_07576 [Rhodopirellula maiorica SM1]
MAKANRTTSQDEIKSRIQQIDEILASGVESVTTAGTTTKINADSLRKERSQLRQQIRGGSRRRLFNSITTDGV